MIKVSITYIDFKSHNELLVDVNRPQEVINLIEVYLKIKKIERWRENNLRIAVLLAQKSFTVVRDFRENYNSLYSLTCNEMQLFKYEEPDVTNVLNALKNFLKID